MHTIASGPEIVRKSARSEGSRFGLVPEVVVGLGDVVLTDASKGTVSSGALSKIDPGTDKLKTFVFPSTGLPSGLAIGAGAIWETFTGGTLLRIDPRTFRVEHRFDLGGSTDAVAVDDERVWVGDNLASTVRSIDPRTGSASDPIRLSGAVDGLAVANGQAWVLDRDSGTVTPVDASSGAGQAVRVGDDPSDIVAGLDAVWVTDQGGDLYRIDPVTHQVVPLPIGSPLGAVAIDRASGRLWVLVLLH